MGRHLKSLSGLLVFEVSGPNFVGSWVSLCGGNYVLKLVASYFTGNCFSAGMTLSGNFPLVLEGADGRVIT